jgi:methylated-DNA-[protein]-cysteine S-methyltransferase
MDHRIRETEETERRLVEVTMPSPVGPLRLLASDDALVAIYFPDHAGAIPPGPAPSGPHPVLQEAQAQLRQYFGGARTRFTLPTRAAGTAFQRAVWQALAEIPFGTRLAYAALAARIGRPRAHRAVGTANGCNPLSIIVPCHRVVGSNGSLTGYAGGLAAKRWLLAHEAQMSARGTSAAA